MCFAPQNEAWPKFQNLCRRAMQCRDCFERFSIEAPTIDIAQPRWVGPRYWKASRRVLAVMTIPGSGEGRTDGIDASMRAHLASVRDGRSELWPLLEAQRQDFQKWRRFLPFFEEGLDLDIDELAFANIAWCATKGNKHGRQMLDACFDKFTNELIRLLKPTVVLLVGTAAQRYRSRIEDLARRVRIVETLHCSHRKGRKAEQEEFARVRRLLDEPDGAGASVR